jgi:hypothetical protein
MIMGGGWWWIFNIEDLIYIYGFDHMRPLWLDMLRRINWELNQRANTWIRPAKIEKLPFAVSFFRNINREMTNKKCDIYPVNPN